MVRYFVDHLDITSRIHIGYQVVGGHSRHRLVHPVAIAIVNNGDIAMLRQMVLKVVDVPDSAVVDGVPVVVVNVRGHPVVGIVVQQAGRNRRHG